MRKALGLTVVVALLLPSMESDAARAQWSTAFGGDDARTSCADVEGPRTATVLWRANARTDVPRQLVVDGDRLFTSTYVEGDPAAARVMAFALSDGSQLWSVALPDVAGETNGDSRVLGARRGRVYASRCACTEPKAPLLCLEGATGKTPWVSGFDLAQSLVSSIVFAANGDPIVQTECSKTGKAPNRYGLSLRRIDAGTGRTVWELPADWPYNDATVTACYEGRLYAWVLAQGLFQVLRIDEATGVPAIVGPPAPPAPSTQSFYLGCGHGGLVLAAPPPPVSGGILVAYRDTDTELVESWQFVAGPGWTVRHAVGPDGTIYTRDPDGDVVRLAASDGRILARSDRAVRGHESFAFSPFVVVDGHGKVYVNNNQSDASGELSAYDADLHFLWSLPTPRSSNTSPVLAPGGRLLVHTTTSGVVCLRDP